MVKRRYLIIIVFIVVVHFIATSIIGHYIAMEIGTKMGNVVASGLSQSYESTNSSDTKAENIHKEMQRKSEEIFAPWKTISIIISLPAKPLTNTFWRCVAKRWVWSPALQKEISREQMIFRAYTVDYLETGVNSISFGILLYFILWVYYYFKTRRKVLHVG